MKMKGPNKSVVMVQLAVAFMLVTCTSILHTTALIQKENLPCTLPGKETTKCVRLLARGARLICCDFETVDFNCLCTTPNIKFASLVIGMAKNPCGYVLPDICAGK